MAIFRAFLTFCCEKAKDPASPHRAWLREGLAKGLLPTPPDTVMGWYLQGACELLMLALTCLLAVFFVAYVLWMQGTVLVEARRHAKELQTQRDLADKAEASRFTELRGVIEELHAHRQQELLARLDALEAHVLSRAQESDNSTAAYVGQLEHQVQQLGGVR